MDDAPRMSRFESASHLERQRKKLVRRHRFAADALFQGSAVQEFHGDERLPGGVIDVVNRTDMGMVECGSGMRLDSKTADRMRILSQFRRQKLQRDDPLKFRVFSLVHDPHAAAANLLHDAETADKRTRWRTVELVVAA